MPDPSPPSPTDRRVWRLGFLLTGNADAASSLVTTIHRARHSPSDPALLDRYIIQHARSLPRASTALLPATPTSTPAMLTAASDALSAALKLSRQPQEAWTLKRLDDLDDLHIARAMDCSKTAAKTHLAAADEAMGLRLAERLTTSIGAIRNYADSLDPAPIVLEYRERLRSQRLQKLKLIALISGAITLILGFIALKVITS